MSPPLIGITGPTQGIGREMAAYFANKGFRLILLGRDAAKLDQVCQELGSAVADRVCVDLKETSQLEVELDALAKRHPQIGGWINNAAYNPNKPVAELTLAHFEECWRVNTLAAYAVARSLRQSLRDGGGSVVNIGSVLSRESRSGDTAYTSSKAGLEGLTRALAVELAAERVRVNGVAPGAICTDAKILQADQAGGQVAESVSRTIHIYQHSQPLKIIGRSQHIAAAVDFLLSPAAEFITGQTLFVDGGLSAWFRGINNPDHLAATRPLL